MTESLRREYKLTPQFLVLLFNAVEEFSFIREKENIALQSAAKDRRLLVEMLVELGIMNKQFRAEELQPIFYICDPYLNFEINSEGTKFWLGIMLALKEMYGLSDQELENTVRLMEKSVLKSRQKANKAGNK